MPASAPELPAGSRNADVLAAVFPAARGVFCISQGLCLRWASAENGQEVGGSLEALSLSSLLLQASSLRLSRSVSDCTCELVRAFAASLALITSSLCGCSEEADGG